MAKKKKQANIILIILAIAVSIYLLNYFGVFDRLQPFASTPVPQDCPDGSLCKTQIPPYVCPFESDFCMVKGKIYCEQPTSSQSVVFRGPINGVYGSGTSFDLAIAVGLLRKYIYEGNQVSTNVCTDSNTLFYDNAVKVIQYNNNIYACYPGNTGSIIARSYRLETGNILDDVPKDGECELSNVQCVGSSPYSCSATFETSRTDGSLKEFELVSDSKTSSWSKETGKIFRLESGENASFLDGTFSKSEVLFNTYILQDTCTRDYCNGNGYVVCENGIPGEFIPCSYGCSNGQCINPYQVEIKLRDERGFERSSFGKKELVKVYVNIKTSQSINGQLTIDLREGSIQGDSYDSQTVSFSSNTDNIFEYNIPITGDYFIILKIDYPQLSEPEFYGTNPGELKSFEIVEDFTATLRVSQTLGNVQNMNKFYTGYPIKVEYIFKEPGDAPVLPDNAMVTYQIGTFSKTELTNPTISQDDFAGYYTYYFTPTQTGVYKFEGTATKGSFTTTPSNKGPYPIEKDSIVLEYTLDYNPVETGKFYSDILEFTTKNRNKQLIETDNTINVKLNGVESGIVPVKGSNGIYSIDYTFTQDNADYSFTITSKPLNQDLTIGELTTELIKSGKQEDEFCKSDSDCGIFSVCNSGNCETNINLIITLIVGLGALILVIVIAYKFIKNKKKKPSFGGGL